MLDYYLLFVLIFAGFGSGTSGVIMLPVLTLIANKHIHQSIGTSLIIDCLIGAVAGFIFLRKGKLNN